MTATKRIGLSARRADKLTQAAQDAVKFTVTGSSPFPLDMLRYDRCWPALEEDAVRIKRLGWDLSAPVTIRLAGLKAPTADRWRSFGWEVTPV